MEKDKSISQDAYVAACCMSLGAVILKPASKPPAGFAPSRVYEELSTHQKGYA